MKTSDALEIIDRRYFQQPDPERDARMRAYDLALDVAQAVYDARATTGLDQAAFAKRVGLTPADVADLEDADHQEPVSALRQIAAALGKRLELRIVPLEPEPTEATAAAA